MNNIDWNDLKYLLAIADAGSLNAAAGKLRVNASTVFRRLNALEEQLQTRLFERLPQGYQLTPAGEEALRHVKRMADLAYDLSRSITGQDVQLTGNVVLTAPENIANRYLPPLLARFAQTYPGIHIELSVSGAEFDLSRREADIALRATSRPPEDLVGRKLFSVPWFVFASKAYAEELRRYGWQKADVPVIGPDKLLLRLPAMRWLEEHTPRERIRFRSNAVLTMSTLVRAGAGVAILPSDLLEDGLLLTDIAVPRFEGDIWLLTHPDLRHNARIQACMSFLREGLLADPQVQRLITLSQSV